jgi:single-strand DNA-binding protein
MNNLNSILLEGKLDADPELAYAPSGQPTCSFTVVCNRYYKKGEDLEEETSHFDVRVQNRLAEVCHEYLKKGRGVRVVGRLAQETVKFGNLDQTRVFIAAEHVEFRPATKPEEAKAES